MTAYEAKQVDDNFEQGEENNWEYDMNTEVFTN